MRGVKYTIWCPGNRFLLLLLFTSPDHWYISAPMIITGDKFLMYRYSGLGAVSPALNMKEHHAPFFVGK